MSADPCAAQQRALLRRVLEATAATVADQLAGPQRAANPIAALQQLLALRAGLLSEWPQHACQEVDAVVQGDLRRMAAAIASHDREIIAYLTRCRGALLELINAAQREREHASPSTALQRSL